MRSTSSLTSTIAVITRAAYPGGWGIPPQPGSRAGRCRVRRCRRSSRSLGDARTGCRASPEPAGAVPRLAQVAVELDQPGPRASRASAGRTRSPRRSTPVSGRGRARPSRAVARSASTCGRGSVRRAGTTPAAASRPCRTTANSQPPLARSARGDQLGQPRQGREALHARRRPDEGGQPVAVRRRLLVALLRRRAGRCAWLSARRRAPGRRSRMAIAAADTCVAYGVATDSLPVARRAAAAHLGQRARAGRARRGTAVLVHWRSGNASCSRGIASSAVRGERERPEVRGVARLQTSRTSDSRGNASTVSLSHSARSGKRDRRL